MTLEFILYDIHVYRCIMHVSRHGELKLSNLKKAAERFPVLNSEEHITFISHHNF